MKSVNKAAKYLALLREGGENAVYSSLAKRQKRFAKELVRDYGYSVHMALQQAFIWLYPSVTYDCLYDYRTGEAPLRHINGKTGAIGAVFTAWERTELDLRLQGYNAEEIADYKVRKGL
jgi:hypothetical protein